MHENSSFSLFLHILFSFIIVIGIASSLRLIEHSVLTPVSAKNYNLLAVQPVLAAELTNKAELFQQSHSNVNLKPDAAFTFTLKYTNSGESTWTKKDVYLKSSTTALKFRHDYWPDAYLPAQLQEKIVEPGQTGTFVFALQAPGKLNNYSGDFVLVNNNVMINGGNVSVGMNVVNNPEDYTTVATEPEPAPEIPKVCTLKLNIASTDSIDNTTCVEQFALAEQGPDVRVGIYHTDESITVTNNEAWQVYDKNDTLLASVQANQSLTFIYIDGKKQYAFDLINKTIRTESYLNLNNFNNGLFTISSYDDSKFNPGVNYNQFSGNLEIKYNDYRESVWVIETLPLEDYLYGIRETSDADPSEYMKALAVAARTYALYHVNKFIVEDSFFDVYPDERDQVYKGYAAHLSRPNFKKAVEETEGVIATYDNGIIISYYSARSGGKTISHNSIPYLKSVKTPYTSSKSKWGHAMGMDQQDARARARQDDWTYDQILKYYYTGIQVEKIY